MRSGLLNTNVKVTVVYPGAMGDGFRPDIRYVPRLFGMLVAIAGVDALVNAALGSNYLFINEAPAGTPAELFEQWVGHPGYVGLLALVVVLLWAAMYLPWIRTRGQRSAGQAPRAF